MNTQFSLRSLLHGAAIACLLASGAALAADRGALERDARAALSKLTSTVPAAKSLSGIGRGRAGLPDDHQGWTGRRWAVR